MKKKLMMIAVLLGALSLGACVDDNETQSVTDVRNAKAEQLKARAELNNAKAQATKIAADAEVALMNAQAKAQQALAAQAKAEVERIKKENELIELQKAAQEITNEEQRIENQQAQLEVEEALRDLEAAKAQAEKDLADVAAGMAAMEMLNAAALAQAQADLLAAQQAIIDYEAELAEAAAEAAKKEAKKKLNAMTNAANAYALAVDELVKMQEKLTNAKAKLIKLEADLVDLETLKAENNADYENQINTYENYIAKYKEYTNYADVDELNAKVDELTAEQSLLQDAYLVKLKAYNEVVVDNSLDDEAYEAYFYDDLYQIGASRRLYVENEDGTRNTYSLSNIVNWYRQYTGTRLDNNFNFSTKSPRIRRPSEPAMIEIETGTHTYSDYFYSTYTVEPNNEQNWMDARSMELRVAELLEGIATHKENDTKKLTEYKLNYDGAATGYYPSVYSDSILYAADANKLNACDSTASAKAIYEADPTDYTKEQNYKNALEVELWLKESIANLEANLETLDLHAMVVNKYLVAARKLYTEEGRAELQAKLDAYNKVLATMYAEKTAALKEYMLAYWAWKDVTIEINAINEILDDGAYNHLGATTIASEIAYYEDLIAGLKKSIEDNSAVETKEQAIEILKLRIEKLEVKVKAAELAEAAAKEDLDELLAEDAE